MVRLEKHLVDAYASGSRWAQYLQVPGGEKFQISFLIFEFSDLVLKTIRDSLLELHQFVWAKQKSGRFEHFQGGNNSPKVSENTI